MNGWGWTMMIVWTLIWFGFLGLIGWAIVMWSRATGTPGGNASAPPPPSRSARDLLDERLASGEIDFDEYERRRAALERPHAASPS